MQKILRQIGKYYQKKVVIIKGFTKKICLTLFLAVSVALSQGLAAFNGLLASASEEETLVIRHLAKVPDGRQYVLGVETIENITDIYYYSAAQSPVASEFLKSGYHLSDEKNRLIEADVVANGGKIDLEYTPDVQTVNVTYYKLEDGIDTEMGSISDSAYVGEEYKPQLPVYDEADVLATLISDEKYVVKYGENNFKVKYEITTVEHQPEDTEITRSRSSGGKTAYSVNRHSSDGGYVHGYPDGTFRADSNIKKKELYSMLYELSGGYVPEYGISYDEIASHLWDTGIISEISDMEGNVTWTEFYDNLSALGGEPARSSAHNAPYETEGEYVTRAEAVSVINEMYFGNQNYADLENPFTDVYEDDSAYFDILRAAN